jgi:hypothetical protein
MKLLHLEHELSWIQKSCLYVVKNGKRTQLKLKAGINIASIIDGNEEINESYTYKEDS